MNHPITRDPRTYETRNAARWRRIAVAAVLALIGGLLVSIGSTTLTASPAQAEQNVDTVEGASNPFFVYLNEGESLYVDVGNDNGGVNQLYSVVDQNGDSVADDGEGVYGPATAAGVWQVEVGNIAGGQFQGTAYWNITAMDAAGNEVSGRVWSELFRAIQQVRDREVTIPFWVVNDSGYIYAARDLDYDGFNSRIRADAIGNETSPGSCLPSYISKEAGETGGEDGWAGIPECGGTYRVFFAEPAADLPATAPSARGEETIRPEALTEADVAIDDLAFAQDAPDVSTGTFSWSINDRFTGSYWLEIDVDGDGSYDGPLDRAILQYADGSGEYSHAFDGLDGEGNALDDCSNIQARIRLDKVGEVHFTQDDVETRSGLEVIRQNGPGAPDSTTYWDDTQLADNRASTTPELDGTAGADSTGGAHGWDKGTTPPGELYQNDGWGDSRAIDDWAYAPLNVTSNEVSLGGTCIAIEKTSDATEATRVGDEVTYTVTATNTGASDFTAGDPAVILDDLSNVLDDAIYNDDAQASQPGEVAFESPLLSWSGALPAGESVELTYTVTLQAGGDGHVRNVAWVPNPGGGDETPACDPPNEDGVDPDTGEPCGEATYDLPRFTIDKVANMTELPEDGGTVTYTVTVRNEGPGNTTTENPGTITDDLSEVLDDGDFVDASLTASVGDAVRDGDELTWTGPLAAGEEATITYEVTYDSNKGGNNQLINVACLPVELALDPEDRCRPVEIPGAALQQWKTSDPASGESLDAGDEVTYTLHFRSIGQTDATVDNSDDLTEVLDDAELIGGPTASNDALTVALDGNVVSIAGSVPAGEEYTVTYTVRVNAFEEQGDHTLANALADCDPVPGEDDTCETQHPIRNLEVEKTSDVEDARTGDTVTYTVTVTNTGEGDYTETEPATATDDLADVIDDATFNDDAEASTGSVSYGAPTLSWSGALGAGESATITYTVSVTNAGNHELLNVACVPVPGEDDNCATNVVPVPNVIADKTSDPESGAAVEPGDVVTYTLSWTNDGEATGEVDSTDDLTEVLDDADITSEPVSDTDAVTVTRTENALRVVGPIEPSQTVTVIYEVTVKPDGERANNQLDNVLVPDDPEVPPPPPVEHPVPALDDWKTVDPASGTTVQPGQVVTYTLHFESTGKAPVEVDHDDVISQVLDDADVTSEPVASSDALNVTPIEDGQFTITGTLEPGQYETVIYQVTVKPDSDRGDDKLGNFLVPSGEVPAEECVPADDQRPDCTVNHVSEVDVIKGSDPASGTEVDPGEEVTYTLTFTNRSDNLDADPAAIDYTDHMADVLDDATLTGGPTVSNDDLTAVAEGDTIRITGSVPTGEAYTVTYTVTVKAYAEQDNHELGNVVAITGEEPICIDETPLCTNHPVKPGDGLAVTGGGLHLAMLVGALLLLGTGGGLLLITRRRKAQAGAAQDVTIDDLI